MVHGDLPHIQRLPKCAEASPTDQIFQIGPGEALRAAGEGVQVHIFGQRHFPGVDADNPPPSALVGDADIDQFIETAGPEEGRVDQIGSIGSANQDYRQKFLDRKSVESGKSVSVRVDLGGRRVIKQKMKKEETTK